MNEEQFRIICKKLDKLTVVTAIQSVEDRDKRISMLRKAGLTSAEAAPLVGLTESGIRDSKGWKGK